MKRVHVPEECIQRYLAGDSPNRIAADHDFHRMTLLKRLRERGIPLRDRSVAEVLKNAQRTPEERKRHVAAAHAAARGRKASWEERARSAQSKMESACHASPNEKRLLQLLRARGAAPVLQQAAGIYNIDLGWWPLAIEVYGGGWHAYGQHRTRSRRRFEYLVSQGWVPVIVWCISGVDGARDMRPTPPLADALAAWHAQVGDGTAPMRVYRHDGALLQESASDFAILEALPSRAYRRRR